MAERRRLRGQNLFLYIKRFFIFLARILGKVQGITIMVLRHNFGAKCEEKIQSIPIPIPIPILGKG
jgi:hypothetical protein